MQYLRCLKKIVSWNHLLNRFSFNEAILLKLFDMKKLLYSIIILSFFANNAYTQTWSQLTSGTSAHLLSIHFADNNTGYVVGTSGTILKTTNGGCAWSPQSSGTSQSLYAAYFTDALKGWAVGDNTTILKTTDGGTNWTPVPAPSGISAAFRVVWFLDANTGFIAGGLPSSATVILKTTDGGATWAPLNTGTSQVIYGIYFTDSNNGFASDFDGKILRTTDGGASWTFQTLTSTNNLHGIYFTDASHGYVVGGNAGSNSGVIFSTTDGGVSWGGPINIAAGFLTDIKFFGTNTGYAVGGHVTNNTSVILKTTDAGITWTPETTSPGTVSRQYRVFLLSPSLSFSCGLNGSILKTPVIGPEICNGIDDDCDGLIDAADPTLIDTQNPTPICNGGLVATIPPAPFTISGSDLDAGSFDNCGPITLTVSQDGVTYTPTTDFHCPGTFPVYLGVTDGAGNFDYCQTTILIQDVSGGGNVPPNVACASHLQVSLDANCQATINVFVLLEGGPYGADCYYLLEIFTGPGFTNPVVSGFGTVVIPSGYAGQTLVYQITNTDSGAHCDGTIELEDNTPPSITCPPDKIIAADENCQGLLESYPPVTLSDNCTPQNGIIVTQTVSPPNFSGINDVLTVTLTADDGNGNTASCSFTVTLADLTPPVISCPGDQIRSGMNQCGYTAVGTEFDFSFISENCISNGITIDWSLTGATTGNGTGTTLAGIVFQQGVTTVLWTMTDGAGNPGTCSFTVTVNPVTIVANAGFPQTGASTCGLTTTTLAANTPTVGTGIWSIISGTGGSFANPANPTTTFSGTPNVLYTLRWTISSPSCPPSTSDVNVRFNEVPTIAAAGADRSVCDGSSITLAANTPVLGTGSWVVLSGPSTALSQFSSISNPTATFTPAGGAGSYLLQWNIANSPCPTSSDFLVLTVIGTPFMVNPVNQTVCNGSATAPVNFAGSPGAGFIWTCSDPSIGLAASGMGNIPSFTAVNTGASPKVATVTATPVAGGFAYISNRYSNDVSVINTSTNIIVATIPVGIEPIGVCTSPDGSKAYVTNLISSSVSVINTATYTVVATIGVGGNPIGIASSPDGSKVYVANSASQSVSVINTVTNTVSATFAAGINPSGLDLSPDGSVLYISNNHGSGNVTAVNTTTNLIITTIGVGDLALGIDASPDGSKVYVANSQSNTVSVINTSTNTVIATIPVSSAPIGVVVSPDNSRVYVSNTIGNVAVINTTTNTVLTSITTGLNGGLFGISISPDGSRVYVANRYVGNNVAVIDAVTNSVMTTIAVGSGPHSFGNFITGPTCSGTPVTFTITVQPNPAVANAGPDQTSPATCGLSTVTLAANTPTVGTGMWTEVGSSSGVFANPNNPTTTFSGQPGTIYTLRWTITNPPCQTSFDDMVVVFNENPTVANGGPSFTGPFTCGLTTVTLGANTPVVGTGLWSIVSGAGGSFANASNPATTFSGIPGITYALRWTISNPPCPASVSNITVKFIQPPTVANAGADLFGCANLPVGLSANTPLSGSGTWSVVSGPSTAASQFSNIINPTATFTASGGSGVYTLRWTITNAGCPPSTDDLILTITSSPVMTTPANQSVCAGSPTAPVNFTGTTGASYSWTCSDPSIGLAATGTGNIPSFTTVNASTSPKVATITATPLIGNGAYAYITDGSVGVSVISTATNTVVGTIGVGNSPGGVSASPDGSRVYVANLWTKDVSVINTVTNAVVATVPVGGAPIGIVVSPNGGRVYVSHLGTNPVTVINTVNNSVISTIPIGSSMYGICISPDGSRVYVVDQSNKVHVINTATNTVITTIPVGAFPIAITISPDGSKLYVTNNTNSVQVINTATNSITATIGVGGGPQAMSVSPDGSRLYVANRITNNVSVVNTATNTTISTIAVGTEPYGTSVSPDGSRLYVVNKNSDNVSVINTATNAVISTVGVGSGPVSFGNFLAGGAACPGAPVSFTITVTPGPTVANAGPDKPVCQGSVAGLSANALTNGTGAWSVVSGPSTSSSQFSHIASPTSLFIPAGGPGSYVLRWTISVPGCLSSTDDMVVTVTALPTVNTPANQVICDGGSTTAINFSGTTGATFKWTCSDPSIGIPASGTGNIPSFSAVNSGTSTKVATITATPVIGSGAYAYIPNYNSSNVSVIQTGSNTVLATLGFGFLSSPEHVAVSPDGSRVYFSNAVTSMVTVINTLTNSIIATITVPEIHVRGLLVSKDGKWLYVSNSPNIALPNSGKVTIINTATNLVVASIPAFEIPHALVVSPDGSRLYVANQIQSSPGTAGSVNLFIINTANNAVMNTIGLGYSPCCALNPLSVCISPDGTRVYVSKYHSNTVSVINTSTNAVIAVVPVGNNPSGMAISPDGSKIYVTNTGQNTVFVINTATNAVDATMVVGTAPHGIDLSPDGSQLYVANTGSNNVSVINTANYSLIATILVGTNPHALGNFITGPTCPGAPVTFTITVTPTIWYKDFDNDGYSDGVTQNSCPQPTGYKLLPNLITPPTGGNVDCNDNDPTQFPGQIWYKDQDNDGYSDGTTKVQCNQPGGYKLAANLLATSGDCYDGNGNVPGTPNAKYQDVHPNAVEVCNGIDDDCDGTTDEGLSGLTYSGNVNLKSQADVNAWPSCYSVINGKLDISDAGITSLAPLANLTQVTGNVTLTKNNSLTSLNGLQGLILVGGKLSITKNDILTDCCPIELLLMNGGVSGSIIINNNLTPCNTVGQILAACPNFNGGGNNLVVMPPCPGCPIGGQEAANFELDIYPNPTNGELNLKFSGELPKAGQLQILDLMGRVVQREMLAPDQQQHTFSLAVLPPSVYFVKVLEDGVPIWTEKLIKQ